MKNANDRIILEDDPEAATIQTVTGWVSRKGIFFGNHSDSERMARFDGATHRKCDCGKIIDIHGYCRDCFDRRELEKFQKMERKEWNGTDGLYSQAFEEFLWDGDDIEILCEENDCTVDDLRLVICVPTYAYQVNPADIYESDLPEDGEVPREVEEAFKELNERLKEQKTVLSWNPGKYAAIITAESRELKAEIERVKGAKP